MRVLIVIPEQDRISGNRVTAMRFQQGLVTLGHQAIVEETSLQPEPGFRRKILNVAPDVTILLHAYRSGSPWLEAVGGLGMPTVVLLTGTDVNHGLDDPKQQQIILSCLQQAAFILLQNPLLANELSADHPEFTAKLRLLPAGIRLGTEPYPLRARHHLAADKTLFLCPAGLRPVKGVLELLEMFDLVAARSSQAILAFCGPILEEAYGQRFLSALESRPWARYLGPIPTPAMASAMARSRCDYQQFANGGACKQPPRGSDTGYSNPGTQDPGQPDDCQARDQRPSLHKSERLCHVRHCIAQPEATTGSFPPCTRSLSPGEGNLGP